MLSLEPHEGPATPADAFVTRYLQESLRLFEGNAKHNAWEDVAFGATVKALGLQIKTVDGLYGMCSCLVDGAGGRSEIDRYAKFGRGRSWLFWNRSLQVDDQFSADS